MIIEGLLDLLSGLVNILLSPIHLPSFSEDFYDSLDTFFDYMDYAQTLFPLVFPVNLKPYLILAIALLVFEHGYKPIKFIVQKIIDVIP